MRVSHVLQLQPMCTSVQETPKVDMENIDVFGVEDVNDVGHGEPLFSSFQFEDIEVVFAAERLPVLVNRVAHQALQICWFLASGQGLFETCSTLSGNC